MAVPPGRDPEGDVRCFETFAADFKKFRRKTDVSDCQWLQTLRTFGLLPGQRCRNDLATIAFSFQGNWREEHLFAFGRLASEHGERRA